MTWSPSELNAIVVGLGYGDEGKGTVIDSLCTPKTSAVVRFNGGPQAGHRVVMADGRDHVFAQWGSGTFRGIPTFHSRFMALDPMSMTAEADHLIELGIKDPYALLHVDLTCLIVTPYHKILNRRQEAARLQSSDGGGLHGSCGMGHGAAVHHSMTHPEDALHVKDLLNRVVVRRKLEAQRRMLHVIGIHQDMPSVDEIEDVYRMWLPRIRLVQGTFLKKLAAGNDLIFEGAQGVLLDESYGFHPHTTWSNTTFINAEILLSEIGRRATRVGVLRAYSTRHGVGPFVAEGSGLPESWRPTHEHNIWNQWQGNFRVGCFDLVAARYAVAVAGPHALAITHLDDAQNLKHYVTRYRDQANTLFELKPTVGIPSIPLDPAPPWTRITELLFKAEPVLAKRDGSRRGWTSVIQEGLMTKVILESWGPTAKDKGGRANS